jgi:outer membrane protein assembly factor BamD
MAFSLMLPITGCGKNTFLSALGFEARMPDSAEALAAQGLDYYEHGKYNKAKESFETLMSRYPFSEYSLLAELKVADSTFYLEEYEEAVLQYTDFEERHPTNEAIPYVMFQIGMCYYKQIDTVDRDSSNAINTIYSFSRLLRAFPNSPYQDETIVRIKAARNYLAINEYYVASYYERTGAHEEAIARLEYLLKQYPESTISPTAKMLLDDLQNDNAPGRSMFGWMGQKLPHWEDLAPEE